MTQAEARGLIVSVPWPVPLFGDLQAYPGLSTLTYAADLRTAIGVRPRSDRVWSVNGPGAPARFAFDSRRATRVRMPSLSRALRAVGTSPERFESGFDFRLYTRSVADLRDSPVLVSAWTVLLLALQGRLRGLSGAEAARQVCAGFEDPEERRRSLAGIYTCVLGGTLLVRHGERPRVFPLERQLPGLLIGYPGGRREAAATVRRAVRRSDEALRAVREVLGSFSLEDTPLEEAVPALRGLPQDQAGIVYAHLRSRDLCRQAYDLLESEEGFDDDRLGEMLDACHEVLRDYLGFREPRIEGLIRAARGAGALGCKVLPGTGCFVAFAPGREDEVVAAIRKAGGQACAAPVSDGMRVEEARG